MASTGAGIGPTVQCRYRKHPRVVEEGREVASCGLAGEVTGATDPAILEVNRAVCELCVQRVPEPNPSNPNPVAASLVYVAGERILARGGVPTCDSERARALMNWAAQHLDLVGSKASMGTVRHGRRDPCFYLGDQVGERPCLTCRGSVRQKVFACTHADHTDTTIEDCGSCPDHEARLEVGGVATWAVGVTTAPRAEVTLERSLRSLAEAGWEDVLVFAEPDSTLPEWLEPHRLVQRSSTLGAWPNWLLSLQELTLRYPWADAYLLCQDDVLYAREVRAYLEQTLWPAEKAGVVSLHTAMHQEPGRSGYSKLGSDELFAWGAQAYVFPNAAARALLRSSTVINHRNRGSRSGLCNIDTIVGRWCEESGFPYYLHSPSPTQHIGEASAIWEPIGTAGRRRAGTFPGESESLCEVMGLPAPAPVRRPKVATSAPSKAWGGSFAICSPLIGRRDAFEPWCRWLLEAKLPPHTTLFLLDNSGDPEFAKDLQAAAGEFADSDRFEKVLLHVRRKPPKPEPRGSFQRPWNIADAYNTTLGKSQHEEDFVFLLDDDIIPPLDCLPLLVEGLSSLRARGARPGAISGSCPSAELPDRLAASRSMVDWSKCIPVDSLAPTDLVKVGMAGTGCLLIDGPLFWKCTPFRGESITGVVGSDSYLSAEIQRKGYTLWLHGGVGCNHLGAQEPASQAGG